MPLLFLALFGLGCGLMDVIASTEDEPTPPVVEPSETQEDLESPPEPEPSGYHPSPEIKRLTPQEARDRLKEEGVAYSQKSFFENTRQGNLEIVELFVVAGMDINIRNDEETQDTALMWASEAGHLEIVQLLVINGADIYAFNALTQNALMFAAAGGRLKVVKYLVEKRASFNIPNRIYGWERPHTVLAWAAYGGHLDVVKYLTIELGRYDCSDDYLGGPCYIPISWAASAGAYPVVQYFISLGTTINPRGGLGSTDLNVTGYSPLMFAAAAGHGNIVSLLINNGANIHARSSTWVPVETPFGTDYVEEFGHSALTLAIQFGHSHIAKMLIEHWMFRTGADSKDHFDRTPLMFAAAGGLPETVQALIDNGADVNATTKVGGTALIYAAAMGRLECVKLLLQHGADKSIRNDNGYTALSVAKERGHSEVVDYLNSI